jgi:gluconolactonase
MKTNFMGAAIGVGLAFGVVVHLACQDRENKQSARPGGDAKSSIVPASRQTLGTIERLDPALGELLSPDAKVEILAGGFDWAEGPVWLPDQKKVLFSDVPRNIIYQWQQGMPEATVYLTPSGYTGTIPRGGEPGSNGLTLDKEGRVVACAHGDRAIVRLEKDGKRTILVDKYQGKRFNSPNDLCHDKAGNLYFTDPIYGLEKKENDPKRELDFCGVYRLSPDGKLTLLTKDLTRPNGVALSPDQKTMYVNVSDPQAPIIWAFDLKSDGTLGQGRKLFDASALAARKLKGLPDGLKVDQRGNLWATGPGGVLILTPAGKHLGTLATGEATANCAFGGEDGQTLFITADMYLCRIKTNVRGAGM